MTNQSDKLQEAATQLYPVRLQKMRRELQGEVTYLDVDTNKSSRDKWLAGANYVLSLQEGKIQPVVGEWVSVETEYPADFLPVLVFTINQSIEVRQLQLYGEDIADAEWHEVDSIGTEKDSDYVTYWMNLPSPPTSAITEKK